MNKLNIETPFELVPQLAEGEAEASVSQNPSYRWCKFVLTDDKPNLNKNRIPVEEFDNLIKTGLYAPIKMANHEIKDGHDSAVPLGTITALKKNGNTVEGLAALWQLEREEDVDQIKKAYDDGKPLNLSWEILYSSADEEENGVTALRGTILKATTLVGMPAYAGRTPILQVASVEESEEALTLEEVQAQLADLQAKYSELETNFNAQKEEKEALASQLDAEKAEKEALAQYKSEVESAKAEADKFASVKQKFVEAGINKEESYFEDNKERLLGMGEEDLSFLLQELSAFASAVASVSSDDKKPVVPVIPSSKSDLDPKTLAQRMREQR